MVEPLYALTSLPPAPHDLAVQQRCIASWRAAGMSVCAFNHPSEIDRLRAVYGGDVEYVPVDATSDEQFGRPYVPITAFARWAAARDASVLLINSDIELRIDAAAMNRLRWLSSDGLCYFVRYNYQHDSQRSTREPWGIDGFMFRGRHVADLPQSFLSMGQPWWDYWAPYTFLTAGRPLYTVDQALAFHQDHPRGWSDAAWHLCALEFDRVTGALSGNRSFEACVAFGQRLRYELAVRSVRLDLRRNGIRDWIRRRFHVPGAKLFLELGAHQGTDTVWMANLPGVTIHAFEPDPRNAVPPRPNVITRRMAIAERDGRVPFTLSREGWGREWTYSSSIRRPLNHLQRYPVSFGDVIEIDAIKLDTYCRQQQIETIDFIWADIQGAEGELARGGREALARARHLYTEFSDDELYEGQPSLKELLDLLPGFRVLELWDDDVLLENTRFKPPPA